LLKFHVLFTIRRVLSQIGCPLPNDKYFNQIDNTYNKNAYQRVCQEFNISPTTDWRYHGGENHGLGTIYKTMLNGNTYQMSDIYDKEESGLNTTIWPSGYFFFRDQGESWGDKGFDYIQPKEKHPYIYFMLNESKGLTKPGLSRLNQSIEAFVYCLLGSQVDTRSSIIGSSSGSAIETQTVFLQLFESLIVERDISKSIQRYQMAVQEAKQKLDFAIAPGLWLLPSNMIINTQSVIGFNNKLQKATADMKFGLNSELNSETKNVVIHNMGDSKTDLPHKKTDNNGEVKPKPLSWRLDSTSVNMVVFLGDSMGFLFSLKVLLLVQNKVQYFYILIVGLIFL